ncbi:FUSC family protein [Crystallibacter degradans]|uniref:FUSC family protein n=1 Tax=Crystallibacter degradans TaxID=2726743 RepID=UPI0014738068|nr:FUSC family protein [Arthrobacter sp. SF27]NMR29378.1 FUSC family protein [Arthrobacter sp. SF27]
MAVETDEQASGWRRGWSWVKSKLTAPRTLLAFKAALAAALAFFIATFMPGVVDDYPYYAPLGAVISMYPTLMGSAKAGLQTLTGLAIGIFLASIILFTGIPSLPGVAFVVGAGVLIAGSKRLGNGQEYVPVTALFVLIIGGPNAEAFSLGYIVQMAVGIAVGLAVNALIFPPLNFSAAALKLSDFRTLLARHVDEIGEALTERWPPEHEDWSTRSQALMEGAAAVRSAVSKADQGRKGNPRALRYRRNLQTDFADLYALENITFHVRDISDVLSSAVWGKPFPAELPPEMCAPISDAMHAVAALLRAWDTWTEDHPSLAEADAALAMLQEKMDQERQQGAAALTATASVAMALKRIIDGIRLRVVPDVTDAR